MSDITEQASTKETVDAMVLEGPQKNAERLAAARKLYAKHTAKWRPGIKR